TRGKAAITNPITNAPAIARTAQRKLRSRSPTRPSPVVGKADTASTAGAGVGFGARVGATVLGVAVVARRAGVGDGVRLAADEAVGLAVGEGVSVGVGEGVSVGVGEGVSVGVGEGVAGGVGEVVGVGAGAGEALGVGVVSAEAAGGGAAAGG